jgi:hypothetical protein
VAHADHAFGQPPGNVVQRYPVHLLDRKTRSTPEWAYFNSLLEDLDERNYRDKILAEIGAVVRGVKAGEFDYPT